jgi:hypothetical protein
MNDILYAFRPDGNRGKLGDIGVDEGCSGEVPGKKEINDW